MLVCVCVHAPDITGWRLLSVSNVILNALQLKKFDTVSIQVGEIYDASILSEDSLLISFGKFSFLWVKGVSVLFQGIHLHFEYQVVGSVTY